MNARWHRCATVAATVVEVASEANVTLNEISFQPAPSLAATAPPSGFPEVVVDVRHPGDRQRLAQRLGLPHPEAFPSVIGSPGRLETYTGDFGGVRVQVVGPMPNPLDAVRYDVAADGTMVRHYAQQAVTP